MPNFESLNFNKKVNKKITSSEGVPLDDEQVVSVAKKEDKEKHLKSSKIRGNVKRGVMYSSALAAGIFAGTQDLHGSSEGGVSALGNNSKEITALDLREKDFRKLDRIANVSIPKNGEHREVDVEVFIKAKEEAIQSLKGVIEKNTQALSLSKEEFIKQEVENRKSFETWNIKGKPQAIEDKLFLVEVSLEALQNIDPRRFFDGLKEHIVTNVERDRFTISFAETPLNDVRKILDGLDFKEVEFNLPEKVEDMAASEAFRKELIGNVESFVQQRRDLAEQYRLHPESFVTPDSVFHEQAEEKWNSIDREKLEKEIKNAEKDLQATKEWLNPEILQNKLDSLQQWMVYDISSPEYWQKLIGEGYTKQEALKVIKERIRNIAKADYEIDFKYRSTSEYDPETEKVSFNAFDAARYLQGIHEFEHQVTSGEEGMSQKAVQVYTEGVVEGDELKEVIANNEDLFGLDMFGISQHYWRNPSELDARKKNLQFELEQLGILKKGEEFTDAHRDQIWTLFRDGKLSRNSMQIMLLLKPKALKKALNEIAFNDTKTEYDVWSSAKSDSFTRATSQLV